MFHFQRVVLLGVAVMVSACMESDKKNDSLTGLWYLEATPSFLDFTYRLPIVLVDHGSTMEMTGCSGRTKGSLSRMEDKFYDGKTQALTVLSDTKLSVDSFTVGGAPFTAIKVNSDPSFKMGNVSISSAAISELNVTQTGDVCAYRSGASNGMAINFSIPVGDTAIATHLRIDGVAAGDYVILQNSTVTFESDLFVSAFGDSMADATAGTVTISHIRDNYIQGVLSVTAINGNSLYTINQNFSVSYY